MAGSEVPDVGEGDGGILLSSFRDIRGGAEWPVLV